MINTRIVTSILCGLVGFNTLLTAQERPRLVLNIVVDQLRTDYIDFLQSRLSEKGFQRLMQDGLYFKDIDFGVKTDRAVGTAMLLTGSYPYANGITADRVYDAALRKSLPAMGGTKGDAYAPDKLVLSTLSDEIAIDGDGLGAVYTIAVDPQMAVIMAGHAGNSAAWIDENTGRWTVSSFYKDGMPMSLSTRNHRQSPAFTVDTMSWKPIDKLENYKGLPQQKRQYPFLHTFSRNDRNVYRKFLASPMANREVTEVAIDYLQSLKLGRRGDVIDMLNVGYTLQPYPDISDGDYRLELQDSYLRLDRQLERLLREVETTVGLDNTVVMLSSTGYYDDNAQDSELFRIPGGELSLKRVAALLNSYLSAKYGNGNYVANIVGAQLYLDGQTLESRRLNREEVARDARDFVSKMSGIANAYTLRDILDQSFPETRSLRLVTDAGNTGDVYLDYQPGWTVMSDLSGEYYKWTQRQSAVNTPAFIMAPGLEAKTVEYPVDALTLAPTVCGILHIRSPNGAVRKPVVY